MRSSSSASASAVKVLGASLYAMLGGARAARRVNAMTKAYRARFVLSTCERYARYGDCDAAVQHAAYGIGYTLDTGRLDGARHMHVEALKMRELCDLVALVALNTQVIADVPYFLHAHVTAAA